MGIMKEISRLCENEDRKGLIRYINMPDLTSLTGKSAETIADDFIAAHKKMRANRDKDAYKQLNKIHDELQNDWKRTYKNC